MDKAPHGRERGAEDGGHRVVIEVLVVPEILGGPLAAGDVISGTGSDLLFLTKGAPERGVAAYANDLNAISLVVRADDPIRKVEDLKGKTIGTSTTGSLEARIQRAIACGANSSIAADAGGGSSGPSIPDSPWTWGAVWSGPWRGCRSWPTMST